MDGGSGTKVEYLIVKMRTPMTMTMNIHLTMTMNILFCYDYVDANSYCKSGTPPCRMGLSPLGPLFICRFPSSSCTRFSIRNSAVFTQFWGPVTVTILETEKGYSSGRWKNWESKVEIEKLRWISWDGKAEMESLGYLFRVPGLYIPFLLIWMFAPLQTIDVELGST